MASTERVTITLPADLLGRIDRLARNRSRFIREAVEHDLARRMREELRRSLVLFWIDDWRRKRGLGLFLGLGAEE